MTASDVLLLGGFGCGIAAGFLTSLPVGLSVIGVEMVAMAWILERRAALTAEKGPPR